MNPEIDDQTRLISEYYPDGIYSQFVPDQEDIPVVNNSKTRRRRRKNKGDDGFGDGLMMIRKRKLSEDQVNMLEMSFRNEHKLESERKDRLAAEIGLDPRQVAVWFQNRRARWKSKKLEEEYSKLKTEHENAVVEKCRLETELLKLKEQLNEAEREIQRLSERSDGFSSNSPTSSEHMGPHFIGLENVMCMPQHNYAHGSEWDGLYYI